MEQFFESLRVADVLDVAIVSAFLYGIISWLRQDATKDTSRRVMVAVSLFTSVYLLARIFNMYLVEQLMEVLFIVFLLAGVVVFQSEIRRMLDRIGSWSFFRRLSSTDSEAQTIDVITEAASQMADMHMGALMAIKGREPWERQIQGGIDLNGKISQPLLYSIFHHDTPGHDGVALLEGDRITKFGAHLPLSSNVPEVSRFGGTRHAAALGLAEKCDALVIVVSEERGQISIAEGNHLDEMNSAGELKERLDRFWKTHYDHASTGKPKLWARPSLQTAMLAVVLASLIWFLMAYQPTTVVRTFPDVPIEYSNVKSSWSLDSVSTHEAEVSLSGSERAFQLLEPSRLAVSFDVTSINAGRNELVITEDNLSLPSEVSLYEVDPRVVTVWIEELNTEKVPIQVRTTGQLADSLQLVGLASKPSAARLLVPSGVSIRQVSTEPVDLSQIEGSTTLKTALVPPEKVRLHPNMSGEVTVSVKVQKKQARQETQGAAQPQQ